MGTTSILVLVLAILAVIGGVILLRRYSAGLGIALIVVGVLVAIFSLGILH